MPLSRRVPLNSETLARKQYVNSDVAIYQKQQTLSKIIKQYIRYRYRYRSNTCREANGALDLYQYSTLRVWSRPRGNSERQLRAHVPAVSSSRKPSPPFSSLISHLHSHPTGRWPSTLGSVIAYALRLVASSASSCMGSLKIRCSYTDTELRIWLMAESLD